MSFARRIARSCQCRAAAVAKIPTDPFSPEFALEQAKRGDPLYLSIRVLAGDELSDGERLFISDLLNARAGKLYKTRKRQVEQWRMAKQVVALRKAGMKQKAHANGPNFHGISYTVVSSAMPRSAARRTDGRNLWL